MAALDRSRLELRAALDGSIASPELSFGPWLIPDEHDGGAPIGLVLLAIETAPGAIAPSGLIDVTLRDRHGRDLLHGCARGMSHQYRTRRIIRSAPHRHPVVGPGETFTVQITGNVTPGAVVFVRLTYCDLISTEKEPTDGRQYH